MTKFGEGQLGPNDGEGYAFRAEPVETAAQVDAAWDERYFEDMLDAAGLSGTSLGVAAQLDAARHAEAIRHNQLRGASQPPHHVRFASYNPEADIRKA